MRYGKFLLCVLLFLVALAFSIPASPADAPAINEYQWDQLTQDKEFGYRTEKELAKTSNNTQATNFLTKMLAGIFAFLGSTAGKTLIWVLVVSIIIYALYRIFAKGQFTKKAKTPPAKEEEGTGGIPAEDLLGTDWEDELEKAIRDNNLRLAVRYSYMLLLRLLQERHLIQYRTDKTNNDYYYELENGDLKQPFRQLSRQYEYAWYGNYQVAPAAFEQYMQVFSNLKTRLGRR